MDHQQHHSTEEVDVGAHGFARQRRPKSDPLCCPICGVTLRPNEIDQHFALEVERLDKILKPRRNHHCTSTPTGGYPLGATDRASLAAVPGTSASSGAATSSGAGLANGTPRSLEDNGESGTGSTPDECWGTYQKIKNNRQARLKMKSRKRKTEDNVCPICSKSVSEEITTHVEACLRKTETNGSSSNGRMKDDSDDDDDASIDVEGESYEVYEWAGQTRVRATTMTHQGGAFPSTAVRVTNAEDTDDELNVDGDETQIYGPPQYSERDVVYPVAEQRCKDSYLRGLVMANEPITVKRPEVDNPGEGPSWINAPSTIAATNEHHNNGDGDDQVVASLKSKIREYEGFIKNRPKCLICMDDFKKPVVSICCWHVYCEECWLHTLGAKKLCPQCSMITSPTDLRRIYL